MRGHIDRNYPVRAQNIFGDKAVETGTGAEVYRDVDSSAGNLIPEEASSGIQVDKGRRNLIQPFSRIARLECGFIVRFASGISGGHAIISSPDLLFELDLPQSWF